MHSAVYMQKSKTRIKIYIPGELIRQVDTYTFADGRTVSISKKEKLVVPSKKNQQRIAVNKATLRPILLPSVQHQKWHETNLKVFKSVVNQLATDGVSLPLTRLKAKILFYFPDSKTRDLGNKLETISDIMKDAKLIMDDSFQVLNPIYLAGYTQRARPRTEIYLTIITPDQKDYQYDLTPPGYADQVNERTKLMRQIRDDKLRQSKATK